MLKIAKRFSVYLLLIGLWGLSGCAAITTAITKSDLDVQTKMSSTIFLDPVPAGEKTLYVQVRNTTGRNVMSVARMVKAQLAKNGYRVVSRIGKAHYLLQANILRIGKTDMREAGRILSGGYGGTLSGAALGAAAGALSGDGNTAIAGGIVGGIAGTVVDALVKDEVYVMITDIQISERMTKGTKVWSKSRTVLKQGRRSTAVVTTRSTPRWKHYRTRIVSTAEKVNLRFSEAKPVLLRELARSIAGIF